MHVHVCIYKLDFWAPLTICDLLFLGLDNGDLPEIKELKQSLNAQFENQQVCLSL